MKTTLITQRKAKEQRLYLKGFVKGQLALGLKANLYRISSLTKSTGNVQFPVHMLAQKAVIMIHHYLI